MFSLWLKRHFSSASKFYVLAQFPYPSGALHMGHVRVYTITDVIARHRKLLGFEVINPMGWDAFGLPAENAAISRGIPARQWTATNIAQMRDQLKLLNLDINWDREVTTCNDDYYRWTQWIFLQLYKRGLAYQSEAQVNWDPVDMTVLADEQIDRNGRSWRSGALVEKRSLKQWFLKITEYAKELQEGLEALPEWPNSVRQMQRNWIGFSNDTLDNRPIFKIRDWLVSRQRKWGTPIPIIHCQSCGVVPVPESELPVMHSESPACNCPHCGKAALRETDTMDTFVDSSWYFLRFLDPQNKGFIADPNLLARWMPVDVYVGGIEHAIMHLLYARFINRALTDVFQESNGVHIPKEPFKQLICQGLVEGKTYQCPSTGRYLQAHEYEEKGGEVLMVSTGMPVIQSWEKMSKSKFNGVDPTELIAKYGSDALRLYILFKAPPEVPLLWSETEIVGTVRWLKRIEHITQKFKAGLTGTGEKDTVLMRGHDEALRKVNRAYDLKNHNFNTAVAALMKLSNIIEDNLEKCSPETVTLVLKNFALMLLPMGPTCATRLLEALDPSHTNIPAWPTPLMGNLLKKD